MITPRQELLSKKRTLEQQISHIDACLTMFCSYAVISQYDLLERIFNNYQDAYDFVASNNKALDRSIDKWYRRRLYFIPYEWTDVTDEAEAEFVHPDIWKNDHTLGWHLIDGIDMMGFGLECPFGRDGYQPEPNIDDEKPDNGDPICF